LIVSAKEAEMLPYLSGGIMPNPVTERLGLLPQLDKADLYELWKQLFKGYSSPPLARDLLIRTLAYRTQEQAFGSLSAGSRHRLRRLACEFGAHPNSKITSELSIKPGTRLVRQWRGQIHVVNVEARGYEYNGSRYQSLSEIARLITGTRWSGPLFFGVKSKKTNRTRECQ
jgi:hypothetical protein